MSGKHDKAGDPEASLLQTGPIVVRGLGRGVLALRPGRSSRHRAVVEPAAQEGPGAGLVRGPGTDEDRTAEPDAPSAPTRGPEVVQVTDSDADRDGARDDAAREPDDAARPDPAAEAAAAAPVARRAPRGPGRVGREAVGIAVLVVLALVCAGLIAAVVLKTQADAANAAREAAAYTPPPLTTQAPAAATSIAIIADQTATQASGGVSAAERWPALLGDAVDGDVTLLAAAGAGYTVPVGGTTYVDSAGKVPADADTVLLVGGANDAGASSLTLARAVTRAVAAVADRAPDARIVLVGPVIRGGATDAQLRTLRNALKSSAGIADVTWIDAVQAGWLPASSQAKTAASALSAADERLVAARLRTALGAAG